MFEFTLWLLSCGWALAAQGHLQGSEVAPRGPQGGPPEDPQVLKAIQQFPAYAEGQIEDVKAVDPEASTWKDVVAYAPFLTESVAMWYVLQDPAVPNMVKLEVAAALLYAISPYDGDWFPMLGWTDDAAFLAYVFWNVYEHITPEHLEHAKAWLVAHGVDPKPIFALHKEFDEPKKLEDAVEVGPQLPSSTFGADDLAMEVAEKFVEKAAQVFSDRNEHVWGPFFATSIGWSRSELSPNAYVVMVTDANHLLDQLKEIVRSVAYAAVVVRVSRTQVPGQWAFVFDPVQ